MYPDDQLSAHRGRFSPPGQLLPRSDTSVAARALRRCTQPASRDPHNLFHGKAVQPAQLATPKLPVMWCSASMGSCESHDAQALRQGQRLLHARLRHENDELVAAVARHHVRTAWHSRSSRPPHPGQHQIRLPGAPWCRPHVLNLSRSISTTEMGRPERDAAFQLRAERFEEKPPRLDERQPVGDGLLLQFLEHEGVVQRGRQQVGQALSS